ncbi:MAG: hypothetical protein IBX45_09105 [Campylobacterales bacterium]|nr:hypothetical protein [Campylobacterales bacterium]
MKALMTLALAMVLSTALSATQYTKKERLEDMRAMTNALGQMQKTLVGQCKTCLYKGAEELVLALRALDSVDAEDYLPKEQASAHKFATKTAKSIKVYTHAMLKAYEEKDYFEAIDMYGLILNQCASCHMRVRDWDK